MQGSSDEIIVSPCGFPPQTPIDTPDGSKPISSIVPGDKILTCDHKTATVIGTHQAIADTTLTVSDVSAKAVICASGQRFPWSLAPGAKKNCWNERDAASLAGGCWKDEDDGRWRFVSEITQTKGSLVYSLEIEDGKPYIAGGVLVCGWEVSK